MFCEDTKDKRENNAGRSTNTTGNISCLRGYFHLRQIPVLFSLRLLSKIFSLFIEQNRSFPSFLVIIISMPSKLAKHNYLTALCLFYEHRTFSLPRKKPICTSFRNLKTKTATW